MVWIITGGIIYLILVVTLGVMSIRKGHWVMFIIGIFLPFFWLIGALMLSLQARLLGEPVPAQDLGVAAAVRLGDRTNQRAGRRRG